MLDQWRARQRRRRRPIINRSAGVSDEDHSLSQERWHPKCVQSRQVRASMPSGLVCVLWRQRPTHFLEYLANLLKKPRGSRAIHTDG